MDQYLKIYEDFTMPKLSKAQKKAIEKKVDDKIKKKIEKENPEQNQRTGVFKEKYNDWRIYFTNNNDFETTTHLDDERLNRGSAPMTEKDVLDLVKKAIDDLDGRTQNNTDRARIYKKLRDKDKNGYVRITIQSDDFNTKISMSTNDNMFGKRILVHTVQNDEWYDNGMITLIEYENCEMILIF